MSQIEAVLLTDIGVKRKQNQDAGLIRTDLDFYIVADGMGGHQGGEIASKLCVDEVAAHVEKTNKTAEDNVILYQGLMIANQKVNEMAVREPHLHGMGTTATVLKITDRTATILQVGDSRAYFFNRDGIWQITRDHSLVQEKLRAGLITRAQLKTDDMKNVITRSVGYELQMKADAFQLTLEAGDGFLLCSDGLSGPIEDAQLFEFLEETITSGVSLKDSAAKMIAEANRRGGLDNVTVLLVRVNGF